MYYHAGGSFLGILLFMPLAQWGEWAAHNPNSLAILFFTREEQKNRRKLCGETKKISRDFRDAEEQENGIQKRF
jgi:hypothetical protein